MPHKDKQAQAEYNKNYSATNRKRLYAQATTRRRIAADYVRQLKIDTSCTDCGEYFKDFPEVLEFDHIGTDKEAAVSKLIHKGSALSRVLDEIDKCELVCANCHRIRTVKRCGMEERILAGPITLRR